MKQSILPLFTAVLLSSSCLKKPSDKACTALYAFITLQVLDSVGNPAKLDDFYTEIASSKEKLTLSVDSFFLREGRYPVVSDSELAKLSASGTKLNFYGFKNSKKVVAEAYVVGHDECHIIKQMGAEKIQLN